MYSQAREIRWTKPALDYFIEQFKPTPEDIDEVNSVLVELRDHPSENFAQVDKFSYPELGEVSEDVYVVTDAVWEIYFNWFTGEIVVVHIEFVGKSKK